MLMVVTFCKTWRVSSDPAVQAACFFKIRSISSDFFFPFVGTPKDLHYTRTR